MRLMSRGNPRALWNSASTAGGSNRGCSQPARCRRWVAAMDVRADSAARPDRRMARLHLGRIRFYSQGLHRQNARDRRPGGLPALATSILIRGGTRVADGGFASKRACAALASTELRHNSRIRFVRECSPERRGARTLRPLSSGTITDCSAMPRTHRATFHRWLRRSLFRCEGGRLSGNMRRSTGALEFVSELDRPRRHPHGADFGTVFPSRRSPPPRRTIRPHRATRRSPPTRRPPPPSPSLRKSFRIPRVVPGGACRGSERSRHCRAMTVRNRPPG